MDSGGRLAEGAQHRTRPLMVSAASVKVKSNDSESPVHLELSDLES